MFGQTARARIEVGTIRRVGNLPSAIPRQIADECVACLETRTVDEPFAGYGNGGGEVLAFGAAVPRQRGQAASASPFHSAVLSSINLPPSASNSVARS